MEATETTNDGSIESAVASIIAPTEEKVEATEEVAQATEEAVEVEATEEVEAAAVEEPAESEEVEALEAEEEEDYDDEIEYEASELDEDNDQVEDAGHTELESYSVKIDGQEVQVTLDDLKQGYSGQQYVQKGMQEAAQQRKEAESVYASLNNERQKIAQLYQELQQGNVAQAPVPPSRELFESDPIGYMEEKLAYDENKEFHDGQMAQLQAVSQQNEAANVQAKKTYLKQEMQVLQQKIPEFADSKKAGKIKERLVRVGQEAYGYTPEEIGQVMDHRAIQVLHDAMKYRDIMSGTAKAVTKTKKGKPIMKAGTKKVAASKTKVRKRQQAKLKQSGDLKDALGLILNT
ncbi:MAG: hypothetical protein NZ730_09715 [Porticoccaceae bacterium]|nr:hypothetical protein [Porticoccaceae bacterium]